MITSKDSEQSCEGSYCGAAGLVRELRLWAESLGVSRYEVYAVVALLLMLGLAVWRLPDMLRALNERKALMLDHQRQDRVLQDKIAREIARRSNKSGKKEG